MKHDRTTTTQRWTKTACAFLGAMALAMLASAGTAAADAPTDGRIGYVLAARYWAVYQTEDGKTECPHGFNGGPREQFAKLFPDDGTVRTVLETRLMREGRQWHPTTSKEPFPFYEAQGNISYGLNLDGKIGSNDFQSPEGVSGIDNQLYRVIGCIGNYRVDGTIYHFENAFMKQYNDNRWMFELTGVDNLTNDDDVTVTTYRGLNGLLTDATGKGFIAGGTQRVDMRWGQEYIERVQGKIVDGVLTTEPIDQIKIPWAATFGATSYHIFHGLRFQLDLTPQSAEGLLAGYVDVEQFTHQLNRTWSTHHQSYGQLSSPSEYRAMRRLADGYPDHKTGANSAISSAVKVQFSQVFIVHPDEERKMVTATSSR